MARYIQSALYCIVVFGFLCAMSEARPQSQVVDDKQDLDGMISDVEDVRGGYYDFPAPAYYPNIPIDRLQMLFAQYRPSAYLRSPTLNSYNELYRLPESKRQVRYRQCYFNPISCFKK